MTGSKPYGGNASCDLVDVGHRNRQPGAFQETFIENDVLYKSGDARSNWGASGTGIDVNDG